jgi:uncharacterized C2H2 Zn-finger protein
MKYICNICNKDFKQKCNYDNHINKKNKCSNDEIKIDGKKVHKCINCNKIFDQKCNYLAHINKKKKCVAEIKEDINIVVNKETINDNIINDETINDNIINDEDINIDNNMINENVLLLLNAIKLKLQEQNKKQSEQDKKLLEYEKKLQEQDVIIKELTNNKSIITTNSNNTTNNNTTNNTVINNTINIVSHGKEDISKLTKEEMKDILNSGYSCVVKCIQYIHFNERLPEYQNILYTDKKSIYCRKHVDGKWEDALYKKIEEEIIDKHFDNVSEIKQDNPELFESQFRKKLLEEFIDDRNKYESYETEDRYPEYWNDKMKKEKQIEVKKRLDTTKDDIKTTMLNKSKEIKNNKKLSIK